MKDWFGALLSETILSVWWILSGLSTLSTFFVPGLSSKWRLVSITSAAMGFAWANYKVFQRQKDRISSLNEAISSREIRASELTMRADTGSRYMLTPVGDSRNADFNGGFFEFHLIVENTGGRNSIVEDFHVELREIGETFRNLRSEEGRSGVQSRHCNYGLQPKSVLTRNGVLRISAENATDHGVLLFHIPDLSLERFVNAGLSMHGEQRAFGSLHCRLTLTDTTNTSCSHEFELSEG
jgi:hypothetical protein